MSNSSIRYFTGFHLLTQNEFDSTINKDSQALYCIVDAPVKYHAPTHAYNGVDSLTPAMIKAIKSEDTSTIATTGATPYSLLISTPSATWGSTSDVIKVYTGQLNRHNNSNVPVLLLGSATTLTRTVSPTVTGETGVRNVVVLASVPASSVGSNGDLAVVPQIGLYIKSGGVWSAVASFMAHEYVPKTGGTFTGSVSFAANLKVTGTTKEAGAFYSGNVEPTGSTRLNYDGYLYATRMYYPYMADYAECYSIEEGWQNGELVKISHDDTGSYEIELCDNRDDDVFGVISDSYATCIGGIPDKTHAPIALMGKVKVKLTEDCLKGDYIYPSEKRGLGRPCSTRTCKSYIGRALANSKNKEVLMAVMRG